MNCPSCDSDKTTTHRMAYLTSTTRSVSEGSSLGLTIPLLGAASLSGGVTRGESLTQGGLVELVSPPGEPLDHAKRTLLVFAFSAITSLILTVMTGFGFNGFLSFFVVIGGIIGVLNVLAEGRDEDAYREMLDEWLRSWICLRCGRTWVKAN
jgi:hypothetical protein